MEHLPASCRPPHFWSLRRSSCADKKSRLQFWFLSSAEPETKSAQGLAGRRNWEPVLWLIAYVMLWMWLLNVEE